jgi:hypothetical protein
MPSNHFTMWSMLIIMALGAIADPLIHGNMLAARRAAYPADQTKREAPHAHRQGASIVA